MTEATKGVAAMVVTATIWGLSPLYYWALKMVPPGEMLCHRTIWSFVFFACVLAWRGRLGEVRDLLFSKDIKVVALAALLISSNGFFLILAIQIGLATEASLGYYIFPIVAVLLGVVAFGEKLTGLQTTAAVIALVGVVILTYGLGVPPWIALALALTFGFYGLIKKRLKADPVASVTTEMLLVTPFALTFLAGVELGWWSEGREGGYFLGAIPGEAWYVSPILPLAGLVTGLPLVLFSYATQRATMATIGLIQYLNPTLQFLCAVVVFGEPFTLWHKIAFALIWAAVILYSIGAFRKERAGAQPHPASHHGAPVH
jgi:chloramphenicol-sensitive protein RarD